MDSFLVKNELGDLCTLFVSQCRGPKSGLLSRRNDSMRFDVFFEGDGMLSIRAICGISESDDKVKKR